MLPLAKIKLSIESNAKHKEQRNIVFAKDDNIETAFAKGLI